MSREAMKLALEALEDSNDVARMEFGDEDYYGEAITALRQALVELEQKSDPSAWHGWVLREVLFDNGEPIGHRKPEQKPVAWADAIIDDLQGLFDTDGITENDSGDALIRLSDAIAAVEDERKRYTAPLKQEPVAWRTFDGEGGYDYRSYEMNETYDKEWSERNPNHKGWVEPLYTAPPRQWVGLTDEDIHDAFNFTEMVKQLSWDREPEQWCKNFAAYIEAKLKEKNG